MKQLISKTISRLRLAFALGADIRSALLLLFVGFGVPLLKKIIKYHSRTLRVTIRAFGRTGEVHIMDGSDIAVLIEMFMDEEYAFPLSGDPEVIIDLGSNVGISVIYFKLRYPHARVYAFEPNPSAYERLVQNVRQFNDVKSFELAVGKEDGEVSFFVHPESSMSSSLVDRDGQGMQQITVPLLSLSSAIAKTDERLVSLLKFDIEGAEYDLFAHTEVLPQVECLVGEIHLDLIGVSEEEMLHCFEGFVGTKKVINARRYIFQGVKRDLVAV